MFLNYRRQSYQRPSRLFTSLGAAYLVTKRFDIFFERAALTCSSEPEKRSLPQVVAKRIQLKPADDTQSGRQFDDPHVVHVRIHRHAKLSYEAVSYH